MSPPQARHSGCHLPSPREAQVQLPSIQDDHRGLSGSISGPAALLLHTCGFPSIQCLTEHLLCPRPLGTPSPKKVNFSFLRMKTGTQTQSHLASEPFQYVHPHFLLPPVLPTTITPQMSLGLS